MLNRNEDKLSFAIQVQLIQVGLGPKMKEEDNTLARNGSDFRTEKCKQEEVVGFGC